MTTKPVVEFKSDNKKPMKGKRELLAVTYKFTDKRINGTSIARKVKKFYEENSRNMLEIDVSSCVVVIPHKHGRLSGDKCIEIAMGQVRSRFGERKFDFYLHFCNPRVSHAFGRNASTHASFTNAVHELGHVMGFGHSNTLRYQGDKVTKLSSRDPFDVMTMFAPYPSLNPINRFKKEWFLPGEIEVGVLGTTYKMYMLKNLENETDLKTVYYTNPEGKRYWLSFGTLKEDPIPKLVFHTSNDEIQYSFLDGFYSAESNKTITHPRALVSVKISKVTSEYIEFTLNSAV